MRKFPKHMNDGEKAKIRSDFESTFNGIKSDDESLFNWATETKQFYDWFYPRIELLCKERFEKLGHLGNMERTYKPSFLEYTPYEIIPCIYADFISSLSREISYNDANKAGQMIYDYYLNHFKDSI